MRQWADYNVLENWTPDMVTILLSLDVHTSLEFTSIGSWIEVSHSVKAEPENGISLVQ